MTEETLRTVAGRYDLLERAGAGGAGTVFRAHDRVLDRVVAVKLLHPGQDETARARLRSEARIAAGLSHPGIAHIHDYGEELVAGLPTPYVVMQYVEGTTLREVLRRGPMPAQKVADILTQVADALSKAHAAGVIHRDVKPANIMLTSGGRAVLLDFGIARQANLDPLTLTGTIVGTVDYISPEQASGRGATERSDLYALGMVAYEALTGVRPLSRDTQMATLLAHVNEDMPPLPPSVPGDLGALVTEMVRRDPQQRPADAASVARRAMAAARSVDEATAVPPTAPMPAPTLPLPVPPVPDSATAPTVPVPPRPQHTLRRRWWLLALIAAVAVIVLFAVLLHGGDDGRLGPTAPSASPSATNSPSGPRSSPAPATVTVDARDYVGRPYADAALQLRRLGLMPQRRAVTVDGVEPGTVVSVSPHGRVRKGSTIFLATAARPAGQTGPTGGDGETHGKGHGNGQAKGPGNGHGKGPGKPKGKGHNGKG